MNITSKFLKQNNACKEGIKFFERNFPESLFPEGLDISKIEVADDYNGYFDWIEELDKYKLEYDSEGYIIKKTFPNGNIYEYEYDHNGNIIKKTYPDGDIYKYEYDYNNNVIKLIYPNNIIYIWKFEYDQNNNLIKETYPDETIEEYTFNYDSSGRLIQAEDCFIKYLD